MLEPKWVACQDTAAFDLTTLTEEHSGGRTRGFWAPPTGGPHFFDTESDAQLLASTHIGWLVLPILEMGTEDKETLPTFRAFLPLEDVPETLTQSDAEFFTRELEYALTITPECWLGKSWHWHLIEPICRRREGHDYTRHGSRTIAQTLVSSIYDLEIELLQLFPSIRREHLVAFFVSKQVSDHLWEFAETFGQSTEAAGRVGSDSAKARLLTDEARHWLEVQLVRYVQMLASDEPQRREAEENESLFQSFRTKFPSEKLGDLCEAARQQPGHLSKWRKAHEDFRRGSTPDMAFRRVLTGSLSPTEILDARERKSSQKSPETA